MTIESIAEAGAAVWGVLTKTLSFKGLANGREARK